MINLFNTIVTLKNGIFNLQEFINMGPKRDIYLLFRDKVFKNTRITRADCMGNYTDQYGTWPLFFEYDANNDLAFVYSYCDNLDSIECTT